MTAKPENVTHSKRAWASRLKLPDVLAVVFFVAFSLRVVTWFQYPNIEIVGDFRPPIVQDAFNRLVVFPWTQIDFGLPSIYLARIFDPFYLLVTLFDSLGIGLYFSTMIAVYLMYLLVSLLAYAYVKRITNGDRLAAFVAAAFITANVQLIVDREQTAIGFMDLLLMVLPSLVAFTEGISRKSRTWLVASGVLFLLSFGAFPNYRPALLCGMIAAMTLLFTYLRNGLQLKRLANPLGSHFQASFDTGLIREYAKYVVLAVVSIALASIWLMAFVFGNLTTLLRTLSNITVTPYVLFLSPVDVVRLIAKWSFYQSALGYPYNPYASVYRSNPLIELLTYAIPILAFGAVVLSRKRKTAVFFVVVALIFLILTDGFVPYLTQVYVAITTYVPLMAAFRESTNWIIFVVLSYGILIGLGVSGICSRFRWRSLKLVALVIIIAIFVGSTYPLATGDVTRNWLDPTAHGSYVSPSYTEVNQMLPSNYWSIVMPQQYTYAVFNSSKGVLASGNMYPLIFTKPIITGLGTDYLQSNNLQFIGKLYQLAPSAIQTEGLAKFYGALGVKYLVLENTIVLGYQYPASSLPLNQSRYFTLLKNWGDLAVYANTYGLQKMYAASNAITFSNLDDMYSKANATDWATLSQSVFLPANHTVSIGSVGMPAGFTWKELGPNAYSAQIASKGPFFLVLLESYSTGWKAYVNGSPVPEADHIEVDSFANAWIINSAGDFSVTVTYGTPGYSIPFVLLSMISPILILVAAPALVVRARTRLRTRRSSPSKGVAKSANAPMSADAIAYQSQGRITIPNSIGETSLPSQSSELG